MIISWNCQQYELRQVHSSFYILNIKIIVHANAGTHFQWVQVTTYGTYMSYTNSNYTLNDTYMIIYVFENIKCMYMHKLLTHLSSSIPRFS